MRVQRYEPWSLLNQLSREVNGLLGPQDGQGADSTSMATSDWVPAVDIREEKDRYLIEADVPGVAPDAIEISMDEGVLTIQGERPTVDAGQEGYRRTERVRGRFHRRFSLPDTADAEKISASSNNGVLQVSIPKQEKKQPRRIAVNG